MKTYLPLLIFYSLSVYRLAILISEDTLPWKIGTKFRSWLKREEKKSPALKKSDAAKGVACLRCSSVHLAIAVSAYAYYHRYLWGFVSATGDIFLGAMALSAIAIIINRLSPPK